MAGCLLAVLLIVIFVVRNHPGKVREALHNNFLISHMRAERERIQGKAKTITLNHFIPRSYDDLGAFLEDPRKGDSIDFGKYIDYYEKVVQYMPHRADAHSMLGFSYYYAGKQTEAISSYKKAIALNPHIFNFHYNLGVIHFKEDDYEKANVSLQKAVATRPQHTLVFIRSSKIYQDIMRETRDFDYSFQGELEAGYQDCRLLLGLSQYYLKNPSNRSPQTSGGEHIELRVF